MTEFYEENRIGQILRYLEVHQSAGTQKLADRMNVTTRTIRNDIKELNDVLQGSALIESVNNKYRIFVLNQIAFESIKKNIQTQSDYMNSPMTRCGYILKELMNSDVPVLIDDLAFDMNIGRTTLINDLKKLRSILDAYGVSILGKTNAGITLQGDEMHLRFFLLENLFDIIYGDYPIDAELYEMICERCSQYHLDKMTSEYFYKSFVVMIDRSLNDHPLIDLNEKYKDIKDTKAYELAGEVVKEVERFLMYELPEEEILFLALPIIGMRTPMNKENKELFEVSEEVGELVIRILNRIADEMSFNISPTDLLDDFVYHINFMLRRLKYEIRLKNNSLSEVQEKFPLAYKMAEVAKSVIDEETDLCVTEDELGFLASYFGIFLEEQSVNIPQNYQIGIICGSNRITGKIIEVQLKNIMPSYAIYSLIDDQGLTASKLNRFDLLVSAVGEDIPTEKPIIYLSEIFDEIEVMRKVSELKYSNSFDFPVKTGLDSLLAACLDPQNFYVLDSSCSKEENTLNLVDILIEEGQVDESFKTKLIEREKKSSMDFGEEVSFPHLISDVDHMVLAIGVAKATDKQPAQIIVLLCLSSTERVCDDILMGMYNDVLTISGNKKMVEDISRMETSEEFFLYMVKNNECFV